MIAGRTGPRPSSGSCRELRSWSKLSGGYEFRTNSSARRALAFVRAWYPGLNLDQLRTWRQEADEELEAVRPAIIQRASAIADFTDTSAFAPKVNEDGVAQPEEWFGLNPVTRRLGRGDRLQR